MKTPESNAFVLWIDRAHGDQLIGVVEHVAHSRRQRFENLAELGRLLAEAMDDSGCHDHEPETTRDAESHEPNAIKE